ncbi:MAG TPA: pilus assembly protein TadG-related protein [Steroidobacter sp.]|nr:pilus assembly protein TadG-related protein [Steroidobacter sp.]
MPRSGLSPSGQRTRPAVQARAAAFVAGERRSRALPGELRWRPRRCAAGQIAPLALFGVLIASAALILMFNTGQQVTERSQVANAADAAAYSGAVWTARHLNFMAYTNRAMLANHLAVGHLVSYVSWARYVHDSVDHIDRLTQWIPYVGRYIDIVQQAASHVRAGAERGAAIAIPAIDAWNGSFRAAQIEARASLALDGLTELMQQTARRHDPQIRINDAGELSALPTELRSFIDAQLIGRLGSAPMFVRAYAAGEDGNALEELISSSLRTNRDLQRWMQGERGWRENLIVAQLRKRGATSTYQSKTSADWRAGDQLQYRTRGLFGWRRWRRIGVGQASAREFTGGYAGVPSYHNLAGPPGHRSLFIVAVATKRQSAVPTVNAFGLTTAARPLAVAAAARVRFRRPHSGFDPLGSRQSEYANLFNPFWEASLAPLEEAAGVQGES